MKEKKKVKYHKLTFLLSVIGFIGSMGFYFGVLRQIYNPNEDAIKVEQLQIENSQLHQTIAILIDEIKGDEKITLKAVTEKSDQDEGAGE